MCTICARACTLAFFFFFFEFAPLVLFLLAMPPLKRTRRFVPRTRFGGEVMRTPKRRRVRAPVPVRVIRQKLRPRNTPGPKKSGLVRDKRIHYLRYVSRYSVTVGLGVSTWKFRANGLYDPDVAVGGHQPYGFDQLMALYTDWVVLSSSCHVRSFTRSSNEPCAVNVMVAEIGDANDTTIHEMLERHPKTTRLGNWRADGAGNRGGVTKASVNIGKYLNRKNLADDADLIGNNGADPTKAVEYWINHTDAGLTASVGITDVVVTLVYRAMFLKPRTLGTS